MPHLAFFPGRHRVLSLLAVALIAAALAIPAVFPTFVSAATTVAPATLTLQETKMVGLLNADRAALGLVAVQVDARLMAIARARSADMVAKHYFSHTQPDGRNVFTILTAGNVTWYSAGEIIATNNYPMDVTANTANRQWMGSPGHKAIVVSTNFNYVGVGLGVDAATGKKLWTAVYLKGPDRTGARVTLAKPTVGPGTTPTTRKVYLVWTGADVRLQVLTAGLRSYVVERKFDAGAWMSVTGTTGGSLAVLATAGHVHQFRLVAVDKAGNRGTWSTQTVDLR